MEGLELFGLVVLVIAAVVIWKKGNPAEKTKDTPPGWTPSGDEKDTDDPDYS